MVKKNIVSILIIAGVIFASMIIQTITIAVYGERVLFGVGFYSFSWLFGIISAVIIFFTKREDYRLINVFAASFVSFLAATPMTYVLMFILTALTRHEWDVLWAMVVGFLVFPLLSIANAFFFTVALLLCNFIFKRNRM
ncbi:MAG: hypothetical protein FWF77_08500 [Defluviitaleaceae bacterium]|nr:hypothetical protein [Defluviitaleaceae bacterium]